MRAYVVTGGGRGVGRAIVRRLLDDGHAVVVVERDPDAMAWHPDAVVGDAADEEVAERAVALASAAGGFAGWVNRGRRRADADDQLGGNPVYDGER
jgi:NAD(P)-dependent dehydrogenase (short-subunit alcohol dehydrogenase family)